MVSMLNMERNSILPGAVPALSVSRWHHRHRKRSELPRSSPIIRNLLPCCPFSQICSFCTSGRCVMFKAWRRDTPESYISSRQSRDACSLGKWRGDARNRSKEPHPASVLDSGSVGKRDAVAGFQLTSDSSLAYSHSMIRSVGPVF